MSDPRPVSLVPDPSAAQHFLTGLDETAEQWTFQTFDDDRNRKDPVFGV